MIKKSIVLFLLLINLPISAQWSRVNTPADRLFDFTTASNGKIFAGSEDTGLWVSSDGGLNFSVYNTGLSNFDYDVRAFEVAGDTIYAGITGGGVAVSYNGGNTWADFNSGFQTQAMVVDIKKSGNYLFAAIDFAAGLMPPGVYRRNLTGGVWEYAPGFPANRSVSKLESFGNYLLAGIAMRGPNNNLLFSSDYGETWSAKSVPAGQSVTTLAVDGGKIFAGTTEELYVSGDTGATWQICAAGSSNSMIDDILLYGTAVYAAAEPYGVLGKSGEQTAWQNLTGNLPASGDFVSSLFIHNGRLFASLSAAKGVWYRDLPFTNIDREIDFAERQYNISLYPNPASDIINIVVSGEWLVTGSEWLGASDELRVGSKDERMVTIRIFDILGKEIETIVNKFANEGKCIFELDSKNLSSGIYFCEITAGGQRRVVKVAVRR